jgi:hypothetical protein
MQSLSVDPSGPPLQCRGPTATLSDAYDHGSLFTLNECTQVTQATCRPCDDGQGGTLQSVGQHCEGDDVPSSPSPAGTAEEPRWSRVKATGSRITRITRRRITA